MAAFRQIFDATYRDLRLFAVSRCADQALVEEVVQAAYVTAFERLSEYRGGGSLVSWLKGMARNRLLQELQRRRRLQSEDILAEHELDPPDEGDLPPGDQSNSVAQKMLRCLEALAPTARRLIDQRYTERKSVQEIAHLLNRTAGSVSVSLHRVRTVLKSCLGPEVIDDA
jgi:RNA polymerase sigma-70 factor (ECF subfamily)